jgi:hypothetical protein
MARFLESAVVPIMARLQSGEVLEGHMLARRYDPERDKESARRIWQEIGWLGEGEAEREAMDLWVSAGEARVAEVEGQAECLVLTAPGGMRYLDSTLHFCSITGVTTSRIVRRQGLATRLTAVSIAERAAAGDAVAGLGMFEQGFYNRLGMGTGGYEHRITFDPARLTITGRPRLPRRLTAQDADQMHAARLARYPSHGGVSLWSPAFTRGEAVESGAKGFGLGYCDADGGGLSHFIWFSTDSVSHGPYNVLFMAYRTGAEFLELMQVIKGLGDQVDRVTMLEPAHMMLQDLVDQPFHQYRVTRQTALETGVRASAWWQCRILDLDACIAMVRLPHGEVTFNLTLHDPISRYLAADSVWRGLSGDYVVRLGPTSTITRGHEAGLDSMVATVGAFTRLWLGVSTPRGLAVTDHLSAPDGLLKTLEDLLRLPQPHLDWDL